jgi:hypothetical protein
VDVDERAADLVQEVRGDDLHVAGEDDKVRVAADDVELPLLCLGPVVFAEEFESDLKNNLYKIWNRMSSGSYFPPQVRAVKSRKRTEREPGCSAFPLSATG